MLTGDDYHAELAANMPEAKLEQLVRAAAKRNGWLYYHTHDSRRSDPGFPDCVLVRGSDILWRELKKQRGRLSSEQSEWLEKLTAAGQDAGVWRPRNWLDGSIIEELS